MSCKNHRTGMEKKFDLYFQVIINERPLRLLYDAVEGINIDNCNHPCTGGPCLNGGRCIPIRDHYKCSCTVGYENTNCEDSTYLSE